MAEMLQVDLDELRALGTQLSVKAGEITRIAAPVRSSVEAVVMPEAGLDDLLSRIIAKLEATLTKHSTSVQAMSDGATTAAASYETVEDVFRGQLTTLTERIGK